MQLTQAHPFLTPFFFVHLNLLLASVCEGRNKIKPNIIFILADDLGWNDVGYHGMSEIPTPNIDDLASDGVVLRQYYSHTMCTPSRAALMTGRYASSLGMQTVIPSFGPWGLPLEVPTLADKLKSLGYVNRIVGKWHLGFYKSEFLPTARGFDSHFGFWTAKSDYFDHTETRELRRNMENVPDTVREQQKNERLFFSGHALRCNREPRKDLAGKYLTDLFTEEAVRIISTHNTTEPLFLFLSHHATHIGNTLNPKSPPEGYTKPFTYIKEKYRTFAGTLKALDDSIGEVMLALSRKGILDNTVVIFTSDNGADVSSISVNGGSNWPLRGQKFSTWEGALRLPAIVWSSNLPNRGRIWDGIAHVTDWFPTLYNLAGGDLQVTPELEGHDLWPALLENRTSPRTDVLHHFHTVFGYSIRVGKYKLMSGVLPFSGKNDWSGEPRRPDYCVFTRPESLVSQVLNQFHPTNRHADVRIHVNCGERPPSMTSDHECNLENEICLFNLEEDPCEYKNLANSHKEVVQELLSHLKKHESKAVAFLNKEGDYLANPSYYGNIWTPWKDPPGKLMETVPDCYIPTNLAANGTENSSDRDFIVDSVHKGK